MRDIMISRIPRQPCAFGGFTHRGIVALRWSNDWQAGRYSGTDSVWACLRHTRAAFAALHAREAAHTEAVAVTAGYPYSPCSCGDPAQCVCRHPDSNYPPQ